MKGQWGKLAGYFVGTLLISGAVTLGLPLIGGGSWMPDLISAEGEAIDQLFWGLLILSLVIFAIVAAIVIYSITHFRAEPGDMSDGEHIHGNAKMEVAWIIVPTIIVSVIGVLSYIVLQDNEVGLYDKAAAKDKGAATMQVDVHAFSFGWAFRYEDREGKALAGMEKAEPSAELVLPVNEVVRFNVLSCSGKEALGRVTKEVQRELSSHGHENEFTKIEPGICEREWDATTPEERLEAAERAEAVYVAQHRKADGKKLSKEQQALLEEQPRFHGDSNYIDVNHAFWVPEARLKIDAVSGLRTYVQWKPDRITVPGDHFQVVCAELCGSGHNGMRTDMCVVDRATFDWWAKLDDEARRDATCDNLRLFTCFKDIDGRDDLLEDLAVLTKKDPGANCDKAEEAVA